MWLKQSLSVLDPRHRLDASAADYIVSYYNLSHLPRCCTCRVVSYRIVS